MRTTIDINASPRAVWGLVHRDFPEPPPTHVVPGAPFKQTLTVPGTPFEVARIAETVEAPERVPGGKVGEGAAGVVSGVAEHEANDPLALEVLAERRWPR